MHTPKPFTPLAIAFAAGFLATIVFHQSVVAAFGAMGLMPQGFAPWSFDPIPPFGVPAVISKAFWGGLWGILISLILAGRTGAAYWLGWMILGAIALPLVAIFVVPLVKGLPVPPFLERFPLYAAINAMWGLGAAVFLRLFGVAGR